MTESPDWQMGDWGPQRAVLAHAIDAMPGTDIPVWNHAVGTGDAPLELYPKLTYLVTGHVALALGLDDDLALAMMIVAVIVHLAIAALTAVLAMRIAPKPRKAISTIRMLKPIASTKREEREYIGQTLIIAIRAAGKNTVNTVFRYRNSGSCYRS